MLRSFRVLNHRSIRDEQELALTPVYGDEPAVPVAAVYGANASGKSNLFGALEFMASAVRDSFGRWSPDGGVPRQPFKLTPEAAEQPSGFVAEFIAEGVRHTYGFVVDDRVVREEWLHSYPEKRKRVVFEREAGGIKVGSTVGDLRGKLDVLKALVRPNALFLSVAAQSNVGQVLPVHRFLTEKLAFRSRGVRRQDLDRVARVLQSDERDRLVDLVRHADMGIVGVEVAPRSRAEALLRDALVREGGPALPISEELWFTHSGGSRALSFDEQAGGTRDWVLLIPAVLEALDEGRTLVLDEIDTNLHPLLTAQVIRLFQKPATNSRRAQLVLITHDATLLGTAMLGVEPGEEVLRRDQVWFVEKGVDGVSRLSALSAFRPRKGENTQRRYLFGSYDGVPELNEWQFADAAPSRRAS
ncbi:AAA family ATPase [Kutzneria sp. CA-103260]|uniref:AAA family ATPase n=1 Tax=Kutzneria sp. CA-103260 TaxID=2802641 RepID=UPI001BAAE99C|nr:ATP-binding protein [Kutzneria sp. CA-103260]QUQ71643.1 ATPase [Kutzneria sp. CA-103260]